MDPFASMLLWTALAGVCVPAGAVLARIERIRPQWLEEEFRHFVIAFGAVMLFAAGGILYLTFQDIAPQSRLERRLARYSDSRSRCWPRWSSADRPERFRQSSRRGWQVPARIHRARAAVPPYNGPRIGRAMKPNAGTRVLVDGNNVMGSRPDGWWRARAAASRRLVAELEPVARRLGGKWTVVFDGCPPPGEAAGPATVVSVEHALRRGADAAADHIVALVAARPERSDVLVYTSDRRLRQRVTALGAHVEGTRALWELAATA